MSAPKRIKPAGNNSIVVSVFLRSAVFRMTATHSSVFAFPYLLYALMSLNLPLAKLTFYREPCEGLHLGLKAKVWPPAHTEQSTESSTLCDMSLYTDVYG